MRHLKVGFVIVREYQGKMQEVMVVPGTFCWQGQVYSSLSTIAQRITGTSWNGPRFLALRDVTAHVRAPTLRKVYAKGAARSSGHEQKFNADFLNVALTDGQDSFASAKR
jgi:hypothetical protein